MAKMPTAEDERWSLMGQQSWKCVLQQGTAIPMGAYKNAGQGCYSCFLMGGSLLKWVVLGPSNRLSSGHAIVGES